jgi:hypothetical protein
MKYFSVDIETTSDDPETGQILQVAVVFEDTEKPLPIGELPFISFIINHRIFQGDAYCLSMNNWIFNMLADHQRRPDLPVYFPSEAAQMMFAFMYNCLNPDNPLRQLTINIAGKNFANFDFNFLKKLPGWKHSFGSHDTLNLKEPICHRFIDPAILYVDWTKDNCLPSFDECLKRAGIGYGVKHNAVDDARDIIKLIRRHRKHEAISKTEDEANNG